LDSPARADTGRVERGAHRIADFLADSWLEDFVTQGITDVEAYLAKHAAFDAFLDDRDQAAR
jgi:hypothetical protein